MIRPLFVAFAVMTLAACGDDPSTESQSRDGGRAEGEVQGGSISDAMIPFDTLTSQSPPLKRKPASDDVSDDGEGEDEASSEIGATPTEAEDAAEITPTPIASPEPVPGDE